MSRLCAWSVDVINMMASGAGRVGVVRMRSCERAQTAAAGCEATPAQLAALLAGQQNGSLTGYMVGTSSCSCNIGAAVAHQQGCYHKVLCSSCFVLEIIVLTQLDLQVCMRLIDVS